MTNTSIITNERTATWSAIGTNVAMATTIDEVLDMANLNYTVAPQPIYLDNGMEIPGKVCNVDNNGNIKGIVGDKYTICQNRDAFGFVNNISDKLTFVKAGETHWGMIYIIAKLEDVNCLGDKITPYVIFQNSHNGLTTLKTTICPLRIVCQNQFAMSFKNNPNTIAIHHCKTMSDRMHEAEYLMKNVANYMQEFVLSAEELASLKIGYKQANQIITKFFERALKANATERQINNIADKVTNMQNIYNRTITTDLANFKNTGWGLVNAFSDFITHQKPGRITDTADEYRFNTVTFDVKTIAEFIKFMKANAI